MSSVIDSIIERLQQGNVLVQKIVVKENQVFTLTTRELLACCDKNPKHPNALVFRAAVTGDPPDLEVHVDRVDLEALIQDRPVVIETERNVQLVDGKQKLVTTERKTLGGPDNPAPSTE